MARAVDPALSGADLTNAAGPTTVRTYLDVVASAQVATALINQSSFTYPLVTLTVDTTSAGWGNIQVDMDCWIGTSAGAHDIGIYRVRGSTGSTIIIGETAEGDPGFLSVDIRSAGFADNQYVTIIDRTSFFSVLPRIVGTTIYEDYDNSMSGFNNHPPPVVSLKCTGPRTTQWNHIATFVDDNQNYATITFLTDVDLWPTSSSATYSWTVPGSWTVTGGATNTQTFTARVPASSTNYVLRLTITENNGSIIRRKVMVWVHQRSSGSQPLEITSLQSDHWDRTGASLTFTLNDNLLANIPDGAMVCIWQESLFNGAYIQTAVSQFIGWIVRIDKQTGGGLRTAEPQFVGPAGVMQFRRGSSQIWSLNASPTNWQQLPASLLSLSFAQYWLMYQRARNLLQCFDFVPYSTAAAGQRLPSIIVNPGPLWSQLQNLADGIQKCNLGCDPDGTIWSRYNPVYTNYSGRSGITKRDTLTASLYSAFSWPQEPFGKTGLVEGEAFYWDGSSSTATPVLSLAPGFAPGQGANDVKLQGQVVDSQATLNTLTGNYYAELNADYPSVTVTISTNRGALYKPAQMVMVRVQVPANLSPDGVALDRYMIPQEVNRTYEMVNGSVVVTTELIGPLETAGVAGVTKPVPVENSNLYPSLDIFSGVSLPSVVSTGYGPRTNFVPTRVFVQTSDQHVWRGSGSFSSLTWTDISPNLTIRNALGTADVGNLVQDPFDGNSWYLFGNLGVAKGQNLTGTPTWTLVNTWGIDTFLYPYAVCPSINFSGTWFVLLKYSPATTSSMYGYCLKTTDNFATFSTPAGLLSYSGVNALYPPGSMAIGQFSTNSSAIPIWIPLGETYYLKSTNSGTSFTLTNTGYAPPNWSGGGGWIDVPFSVPGGGNNSSYSTVLMSVGIWDTLGTAAWYFNDKNNTLRRFTATQPGDLSKNSRAMNSLTIDSNYLAILTYHSGDSAWVHLSSDGGNTWAAPASAPTLGGSPSAPCINGWPTNPKFLCIAANNGFGVTIDRGNSWTDLKPGWLAAGGGGTVMWISGDFTEVYPNSGVHP